MLQMAVRGSILFLLCALCSSAVEAATTASGEIIADSFIDFEGVAEGTVVTPAVISAMVKGRSWDGWITIAGDALDPAPTPFLTITSAASSPYPAPVSIGGVPYPGGGGFGMRAVMSGNNAIQLNIPFPGVHLSVGFFMRFNGPLINWSPRDLVGLRSDPDGNYQFLQLYDGPSPHAHAHWQPYTDASNGVGGDVFINRGQWYWVTMRHAPAGQNMQINVYDPANGYALVGTSQGAVSGGSTGVTVVQLGVTKYASGGSQSVDYDDVVIDSTGSFPLVPATGAPVADTTAPSVPTGLAASGITASSVALTWNPASDNPGGSGIAGYRVFRNGSLVGSPVTNSFTDSGLPPATRFDYAVAAVDRANNVSAQSTLVSATTLAPDLTVPTTSITSPASGASVSGTITVGAIASDDVGVSKVEFYLDNALAASDSTAPYSWTWNTATASNGAHSLSSKAYDGAGNVGASAPVGVTVANPVSTAAITPVQNRSSTSAGGASLATTFAAANKAGNLIVVAVSSWPAVPGAGAVSDSNGNVYAQAGPAVRTGSASGGYVALYYARNVKAGTNRVSFATSSSGQKAMTIAEFAGLNTISPLDGTAGASGLGTVQLSGQIAPGASGDLIIGAGTHDSTDVTRPSAGFTLLAVATEDDANFQPLAVEYMIAPDASALATGFSISRSAPWAQLGAAFKK